MGREGKEEYTQTGKKIQAFICMERKKRRKGCGGSLKLGEKKWVVSENRETTYFWYRLDSSISEFGTWRREQAQGQPGIRHGASSTTRKKKLMSLTLSISRKYIIK